MKNSSIYIPACDWDSTASLPQSWGSPPLGWQYAKRLVLINDTAHERQGEPVEADVDIHAGHITDLDREVRVARLHSETGPLEVVPSQVHLMDREDELLRCRLFFLADVAAEGSATYLLLYGNPEAPEPHYDTDLKVSGEGYALEVENEHYRAVLGKMNGNWQDHYSKRGPAELVHRQGHGVEGTIHWGPDWSDERVGRYRLTNWDGPPLFDYDVIKGPVCVRIRRWGHPILSIGPQVGRPHKVMATVTYSFWAGQPYVIMESKLEVLEDVRFRDCRNDEFVIGEQLPERAWMGPEGEIGFGAPGLAARRPSLGDPFQPRNRRRIRQHSPRIREYQSELVAAGPRRILAHRHLGPLSGAARGDARWRARVRKKRLRFASIRRGGRARRACRPR